MRSTIINAKPRVILDSDKDVQERSVGTHVNGWNHLPAFSVLCLGVGVILHRDPHQRRPDARQFTVSG
jgi:hypothetical protein